MRADGKATDGAPRIRYVHAVPRAGLDEASRAVAAASPVMARLYAEHGPYRPGRAERVGERFEGLASSITYQQLAGSAASIRP